MYFVLGLVGDESNSVKHPVAKKCGNDDEMSSI